MSEMGMVERVAKALDGVALFSRFNDWTSDRVPGWPIEICRYGTPDEDEIVIVKRFSAEHGEERALADVVREFRARAAIEAMRSPTEAMILAACTKAKEEQVRPIEIHRADADTLYRAMIDAALG